MVRTRSDNLILWPSYFDSRNSRSEGRRVSRALSIEQPTAEEIHQAVKILGLKSTIDTSKSYPNTWWEREGAVKVEKTSSKEELIGRVAAKLKETESNRARKKD